MDSDGKKPSIFKRLSQKLSSSRESVTKSIDNISGSLSSREQLGSKEIYKSSETFDKPRSYPKFEQHEIVSSEPSLMNIPKESRVSIDRKLNRKITAFQAQKSAGSYSPLSGTPEKSDIQEKSSIHSIAEADELQLLVKKPASAFSEQPKKIAVKQVAASPGQLTLVSSSIRQEGLGISTSVTSNMFGSSIKSPPSPLGSDNQSAINKLIHGRGRAGTLNSQSSFNTSAFTPESQSSLGKQKDETSLQQRTKIITNNSTTSRTASFTNMPKNPSLTNTTSLSHSRNPSLDKQMQSHINPSSHDSSKRMLKTHSHRIATGATETPFQKPKSAFENNKLLNSTIERDEVNASSFVIDHPICKLPDAWDEEGRFKF